MLSCTVGLLQELRTTPTIQWFGPDGTEIGNETGVVVSGPFFVGSGYMVLNLEYSVIRTSQGGPYSCQATASILQASLHISASSIINITVQSEYQNCSLVVRSGGMLQVEV